MSGLEGFFGGKKIGLIAEAGTGHGGSINKACELVDAAAGAGADLIKFQHVLADELFAAPSSTEGDLYSHFKTLEVGRDFWGRTKERCRQKKIGFMCSVFGSRGVADLRSIGAEAYKLASPESNFYKLWAEVLAAEKPTFFSTGLTTEADLKHLMGTLDRFGAAKKNLVMMHCVSEYPASPESYNLKSLATMSATYGLRVGLSDHSKDPYCVPVLGCSVMAFLGEAFWLEKHFCLDRSKADIDGELSVTPEELEKLKGRLEEASKTFGRMRGLSWRDFESALAQQFPEWRASLTAIMGDGRRALTAGEASHYDATNRSLHAVKNIAKGDLIGEDNAGYYRGRSPGKGGLSPRYWRSLGRFRALRAVRAGEPITSDDAVVEGHAHSKILAG